VAERVVIVCDVCGASPADQVGIKLKDRNLVKDLCSAHVAELTEGARAPKRGRRPTSAAAASSSVRRRRVRPGKSAQKQLDKPVRQRRSH